MTTTARKIKISDFQIGGDVEVFLQEKDTKKIITAEGIIKGTKSEPFHFDSKNDYFATSLDCVLAEYNIPPCNSSGEYYQAIQHALKYIESNIPSNLQLLPVGFARLEADQLQSSIANEYGCSPSFNCWTGEEIHPRPTGDNGRASGFHIHIGYDKPTYDTNVEIIKAMDLFLGIPSVLIDPDTERKTVGYGCAGNYRPCKHGTEYRTLSGYFASSKDLIEWCYRNTERAIDFVNSGRIEELEYMGSEIQEIINTNDKEGAQRLINRFELEIV